MKKLKTILKIVLVSILSILLLNTYTYAAVEVTDENLRKSLQELIEFTESEDDEIIVEDNIIKLNIEDLEYEIKYDLTAKPTFTIEIPVQKGMTFEEYESETEKLISTIIGYIAVANIQGVDFENAAIYVGLKYLENAFNANNPNDDDIIIVDDTQEGIIVDKKDDPNIYYMSEFPEKVIEYTKRICKNEMVINDSDEINSFEIVTKLQEEKETSCKIVSTLTVNTEADFSKLNEIEEPSIDTDITKENADYVVELKVGQKCKIESNKKIRGYSLYNNDCVEFSEDYTEITALESGVATGYLYVGEDKEISLYITVVENTGNETLEPVILKIGKSNEEAIPPAIEPEPQPSNPPKEENEFVVTVPDDTKNETKDDTIVNSTEIPKAGAKNIILFAIVLITFVIIMAKKVNKYRGI